MATEINCKRMLIVVAVADQGYKTEMGWLENLQGPAHLKKDDLIIFD